MQIVINIYLCCSVCEFGNGFLHFELCHLQRCVETEGSVVVFDDVVLCTLYMYIVNTYNHEEFWRFSAAYYMLHF